MHVALSVSVALEPMALWPEPKVPADFADALASNPQARRLWMDITPQARWNWIR
jgi:Bacteriocin-protection, YdeI or OmpD-Associated